LNKHGFTLIYEGKVSELDSLAKIWRHDATGAQLLSFSNQDANKVFGVTLRTPPHDSTGLPHILEHSVLCGSDKYPVKEPFVELLKGSLQTFLNAFTYPDKTCYPVASANLADFYNLVDVYLDAVFHPRISEEIFQQEGWHLEAEAGSEVGSETDSNANPEAATEADITFKGVVYNEMKGVFSSPEAVLERQSMHALFPDTPYGLESGGDPADIPSLTYADFLDFHRRYYHPSNARFYFWGDDPEDRRLEILGEALQGYQRSEVESSRVPLQQPFAAPKSLRLPFAAGENDQAMITLNWVLPAQNLADSDPANAAVALEGPAAVELNLALAMLDHILLGMPASPLRRALIESELGEDLAGGGMQDELRQTVFSIGLKGVETSNAAQVGELILKTLLELAEGGIPLDCVEAAVNSLEFALRENNTGRFPVGLAIMLRSLTTWLHSDNLSGEQTGQTEPAALAPLRFETPLAAIKQQALREKSGYFENIIRVHLLDNPHRVELLLYPDRELDSVQALEEDERLRRKTAGLKQADLDALAANTARLKLLQETPDTPEDLAKIPRLEITDLPLENQEISQKLHEEIAPPVYFHPQATNGIVYLDAHLDLSAVPDRLLPLVPMLGRAMLEMGNEQRDFVSLNMEIARKTGGMDAELSLFTRLADHMPIGSLTVSGKAAPDKVEELFGLLSEVITQTSLEGEAARDQFCRMLLEEKARLEHGLVPSGHLVTAGRLKASCSLTGWLAENCDGILYLDFIRELASEASANWPAVQKKLLELRKILLNRQGLILSLTATPEQEGSLTPLTAALAAGLPLSSCSPVSRAMQDLPQREALIAPSQVNFMGKGVNLFELGYTYHGSALVIMKYLRTGYLWEKVRVQGGAYGASCSLDRFTGDFVLTSYRDPNTKATLDAFDACAGHLRKHTPGKRELEASIIGAVGELDAYLLPEAKGRTAFGRAITGNSPELRARLRAEVLGCTADDFKRFGELLAEALPLAGQAGLGGADLEAYAKANGWDIRKVL
jgi:Zn-dependent M16 (insulinase) family peptidase